MRAELALVATLSIASCKANDERPVDAAPLEEASATSSASALVDAAIDASPRSPCPADMAFVSGSFCLDEERTCLSTSPNQANHLTLCNEFERAPARCKGAEESRAFCMDRYEYPNREGAHPAWMVSWFDAQATCGSLGKRLCYESEWTMACEGPEKTPFPYGYVRDKTACNIDNEYMPPILGDLYADAGAIVEVELARIDQGKPSGAMARCVSGFGVHDLTGNFDEWVTLDHPLAGPRKIDTGKWSALKGGAWGHVRNACRPLTTSHAPQWTYYFVSFRCCADAPGFSVYVPAPTIPAPAVAPEDRAPIPDGGAPKPARIKEALELRALRDAGAAASSGGENADAGAGRDAHVSRAK